MKSKWWPRRCPFNSSCACVLFYLSSAADSNYIVMLVQSSALPVLVRILGKAVLLGFMLEVQLLFCFLSFFLYPCIIYIFCFQVFKNNEASLNSCLFIFWIWVFIQDESPLLWCIFFPYICSSELYIFLTFYRNYQVRLTGSVWQPWLACRKLVPGDDIHCHVWGYKRRMRAKAITVFFLSCKVAMSVLQKLQVLLHLQFTSHSAQYLLPDKFPHPFGSHVKAD